MPAYNFKPQFAEPVRAGQKLQTIRPKRKHPTLPGMTLQLYTGMRQSGCQKLRDAVCTAVLPIKIYAGSVELNGRFLTQPEIHTMAVQDGFAHSGEFFKFFADQYGLEPGKPLEMEMIKWE